MYVYVISSLKEYEYGIPPASIHVSLTFKGTSPVTIESVHTLLLYPKSTPVARKRLPGVKLKKDYLE